MVRNIVLAVSSLAVLVIVFVGYTVLVGQPMVGKAPRQAMDAMPPRDSSTTQPLRIGDVAELPPGGKIVFKRYDEGSGRPRDMFLCQDWHAVPESVNEIRVSGPELAMVLPSGMIATITADEGQIAVDRIESSQMQPKTGWLAGNVLIVVDRETDPDRAPKEQRPEDLITVSVERLEFDLEIGELRTEQRVAVQSDDFEIAGTGLHLIWNQADNRVETLTIDQGEEFVLYAGAGLFGMMGGGKTAEADTPAATDTQAVAQPEAARGLGRRKRPSRPPTAYQCVLAGGLVAEHYAGTQRIGGLAADSVELLFDVGGGAGRLLSPEPTSAAPVSQPATRPARQQRDRLVLRWSGSLKLTPTARDPREPGQRRRFAAVGSPVVMTRGQAEVRCGKVAYHDDAQRAWLYPTDGGRVEFSMGPTRTALAESVFIDQDARVVKLIGDVELRSRRGTDADAPASSIRCAYWAELHLAAAAATSQPAATDVLVDADMLESARFVGDVVVDLPRQQLTGHQLDIAFRPGREGASFEELFETAIASGDVRLIGGNGRLACGELELAFGTTPAGELYPRRMRAVGAVELARGRDEGILRPIRYMLGRAGLARPLSEPARIMGNQVVAELAPPPADSPADSPELMILTLDVLGEARLADPDNEVAARGEHIAATFEGNNVLATATVRAAEGQDALLYAQPYLVRGGRIDLSRARLALQVDGPSTLQFKSSRGLQGTRRGRPTTVTVRSQERLRVDGRENRVDFAGDVVARGGDEELLGDELTLWLEDVPEPIRPAAEGSWRGVWRQLRGQLVSRESGPQRGLFTVRGSDETERLRKEPKSLAAVNAVVTSATHLPGQDLPATEASIRAPLLEVDIAGRQIVTTGLTQLLMLDRRGAADSAAVGAALGIPSALVSRGASQTAMQCMGRMTYTLGSEGPGRRDTAVFEEEVFFVHRTGREMVHLEQMMPQLAENPELLDEARSRSASLDCARLECWFDADQRDPSRGGPLSGAAPRLASLIASGDVYLRDVQGPRVREIYSAWAEFSREHGHVRIRGGQVADARVHFENTRTGEFAVNIVRPGQELSIDLQDGTIRSEQVAGEFRRP